MIHTMNLYALCTHVFDILFPPSPDSYLVERITPPMMRTVYLPQPLEDIVTLSSYAHTHMRALIHEAKFHGNTKAFMLLHILFALYIETHAAKIDYIIPIPLSKTRLRARGYNQVYKILTSGNVDTSKILDTVLIRARHTQPQTELSRKDRLENMKNAFIVSDPSKIAGKHIVIVDDVTTTGATLHAAKTALMPYSPASVTLIALTH